MTDVECHDKPCARCFDYIDKDYFDNLVSQGYRYNENKRAWEYGE